MASLVRGIVTFEQLASRRFDGALRLAIRKFGTDVQVHRRSTVNTVSQLRVPVYGVQQTFRIPASALYVGTDLDIRPDAEGRPEITHPGLLPEGGGRRFLDRVLIRESGVVLLAVASDRVESFAGLDDNLSEGFESRGVVELTIDGHTVEFKAVGEDVGEPYSGVPDNSDEVQAFRRRFDGSPERGAFESVVRLRIPDAVSTAATINQDAASMYQVGSGLGQVVPLAHAADVDESEDVRFDARIVASHHVYQSSDVLNLTAFEEVYFFTMDDIHPDDDLHITRALDNRQKAFRVLEVERAGTVDTSAKRLLMANLADGNPNI